MQGRVFGTRRVHSQCRTPWVAWWFVSAGYPREIPLFRLASCRLGPNSLVRLPEPFGDWGTQTMRANRDVRSPSPPTSPRGSKPAPAPAPAPAKKAPTRRFSSLVNKGLNIERIVLGIHVRQLRVAGIVSQAERASAASTARIN